jgi:hypothetical protein
MMLRRLRDAITPSKGRSLGRSFTRLGWTGLWLQVLFGPLPIAGAVYYALFSRADSGTRGLGIMPYLTAGNLVLLLFTMWWSYRYILLGRRILDPQRRPSESDLLGVVWTGVLLSTVSMLFSMIVLFIDAANLLFYFLKSPQAGMPVIQTSGVEGVHWVSSIDMLSLMVLILVLFSELIVLIFSLWLLFQATLGSPEFPQGVAEEHEHPPGSLPAVRSEATPTT